jgi:UDP-N-acetylmuramoylalanine--D-glutamate ligase
VNDSKATNLDAVEKALVAQTKPVVLIAGGKDKGFTFDPLRSLVKDKVKSAVLIGEMAESIRRAWDGAVKSEIATSLADAVERARSLASAGDVVLFSPGTSSFDMFKSYADRGDQFRKLVQTFPQRNGLKSHAFSTQRKCWQRRHAAHRLRPRGWILKAFRSQT